MIRAETTNPRPALWAAALMSAALLVVAAVACEAAGTPIVFTSDRDGNAEIYSVDPGGEKAINLTNSAEDESSPMVSPDGRLVAFLSTSAENTALLEVMNDDGTGRTALIEAPKIRESRRWSPDGDNIAYIVEQDTGLVTFVVTADGSEAALRTSIVFDEVGDWSADGDSVLFSVRDGDARGIWIRNPFGVNEFHVTDTPDHSPVWSPDSRKIAFLSTRDGNAELYTMNADGMQPKRLTETEAPEYHISWSPNGKRILFVSERDGNPEIYVTTADGLTQTRLTFNDSTDDQPVWSPDGRKIAFVSFLDGDGEIFVMDANGKNQVRLTNNDAADTDPSW